MTARTARRARDRATSWRHHEEELGAKTNSLREAERKLAEKEAELGKLGWGHPLDRPLGANGAARD